MVTSHQGADVASLPRDREPLALLSGDLEGVVGCLMAAKVNDQVPPAGGKGLGRRCRRAGPCLRLAGTRPP